jgi:glycosyltransferase involved in cell wall biosynthesis
MEQSKLHANLPYLLGLPHDESGEKIHLQKIKVLIEDLGFNPQVEDLQSFIPGDLAKFGYANYALIESKQTPIVLPHSIDLRESSIWVVAHAIGIAAARGLTFKGKKSLSYKFQVHHLEEKVNCDLYKNANYLFTESLLSQVKAEKIGMDLRNMVYIPHFAAEKLPKRNETSHIRIGMCSRFEVRKNVHCVLQVLEKLANMGWEFEFILVGALPSERSSYDLELEKAFQHFKGYSWFNWIQDPLTHEEALALFSTFSFAVHPSGAEAGSNTVVEYLALGIPTILPRCTTFPYMFSEGVLFTEVEPQIYGTELIYRRPDVESLFKSILKFIQSEQIRAEFSTRALKIAKERFTKEKALEKVRVLISNPTPKECLTYYNDEKELYGI